MSVKSEIGERRVVRPKLAQEMLSVSKDTIYTMLRDGRLTRVKLGPRMTGITVESLERLLREGSAKGASWRPWPAESRASVSSQDLD